MNSLPDTAAVIVGLGEVLWDVFPNGPRFGGAPANYACSVAALSNRFDVYMVSGIGSDELGDQAEAEFDRRGVKTALLQRRASPTGVVNVSVDADGVASYSFASDRAWDDLQWTEDLAGLARRTDVVCFGSLGQRSSVSASTIRQFVATCNNHTLKIFDINLRPPFVDDECIRRSLEIASCLKLNEDELPYVADLTGVKEAEEDLLKLIANRWQLKTIALTLGPEGALMLHKGELFRCAGVSTDVIDTVGAGDSFTAAMTIGLLRRDSPQQIIDHACRVAAFVCSQSGATPASPEELRL